MSRYARSGLMIATSIVVMFGLMYLHTYSTDHVFSSETRAYMALIMGAAMTIVMMLFMLSMYKDGRKNAAILVSAAVVFAGALWLVRSQQTVDDVSWMKAMIPHYSIAIPHQRTRPHPRPARAGTGG
jgi:FtsH-binding integral membrane protein